MGAHESKHRVLVTSLERQVEDLATSNAGSLPELRESIWHWPPKGHFLRPCEQDSDTAQAVCKGSRATTQHINYESKLSSDDEAQNPQEGASARPFNSRGDDEMEASAVMRCRDSQALRHRPRANWRHLGTDLRSGAEVFFELVLSDLDAEFCSYCERAFGWATGAGGGVRVEHDPMQAAIADSLRETWEHRDDPATAAVHTFVMFGTYGIFPRNVNSKNVLVAGLAKSVVAPNFPKSWRDFARQCGDGDDDDEGDYSDDGGGGGGGDGQCEPRWMERMGQSWISRSEIKDTLSLVAVAAYPRDQRPSEQAAASRRFSSSLELLWGSEGAGLGVVAPSSSHPEARGESVAFQSPSKKRPKKCVAVKHTKAGCVDEQPHQQPRNPRYIRIITHAMGSFVGHNEVRVFAEGMADGLQHFFRTMGVSGVQRHAQFGGVSASARGR